MGLFFTSYILGRSGSPLKLRKTFFPYSREILKKLQILWYNIKTPILPLKQAKLIKTPTFLNAGFFSFSKNLSRGEFHPSFPPLSCEKQESRFEIRFTSVACGAQNCDLSVVVLLCDRLHLKGVKIVGRYQNLSQN